MSATQPVPAQAPADYPGKTLGIVGVVLAFLAPLVGLILSAVALNQSKAVGVKNTPAKVGLIVGIILTVLYIVFWIVYLAVLLPMARTQMGG
ncbi:ABC-type Na+ efflux pump permease subunit [Friedmanniella endophytica]|uniref:ABC-type Na+ efflux pump permease subunit n=1 Tax=Microlunatus kandeliicorticis TaxID=1759536 RepID=A0A7W3P5E3_9ACTN|nr:hypothetical protein [Microlunatus kandeliicorticis]MBA8793782.1 ABC-type Na+ efflux pump permease subunit [Microlunatus kandeliicorticis]